MSNILKRHGAARPRGLSDSQVADAIRRYESGESLATIAALVGAAPNTVRTALLGEGLRMRITNGFVR